MALAEFLRLVYALKDKGCLAKRHEGRKGYVVAVLPRLKRLPDPITIKLGGMVPPSLNAAYPHKLVMSGGRMVARRYASKEMKAYKDWAHKQLLARGIAEGSWSHVKAVAYTAIITVPTAASDLDNRVKAMQDAILGYLGLNDNKVVEIHLLRQVDRATIGVSITIQALSPLRHPLKWLMAWALRTH